MARDLRRRRWPAVPRWLDLPATGMKYLLLGFFVWTVAGMPLGGIEGLLQSWRPARRRAPLPQRFGHGSPSSAAWPPWLVPALALGTMLGAWALARAVGFRETALGVEAFAGRTVYGESGSCPPGRTPGGSAARAGPTGPLPAWRDRAYGSGCPQGGGRRRSE